MIKQHFDSGPTQVARDRAVPEGKGQATGLGLKSARL